MAGDELPGLIAELLSPRELTIYLYLVNEYAERWSPFRSRFRVPRVR